jgi:hypothetical protein
MRHTRELHIISGELSLLKRTLYPIYNMVNALRDHRPPQKKGYFHPNVSTGRGTPAGNAITTPGEYYDMKVHGADISDAAKVYLADVADHVLILTEEIDILRGTVENMINLVSLCIVFLMEDLQYGCCDTERDDATAYNCDVDLPSSHLSRGIFRYEFQHPKLARAHQQRTNLFLDNCNSYDNCHNILGCIFLSASFVEDFTSPDSAKGDQGQIAEKQRDEKTSQFHRNLKVGVNGATGGIGPGLNRVNFTYQY